MKYIYLYICAGEKVNINAITQSLLYVYRKQKRTKNHENYMYIYIPKDKRKLVIDFY